MAAEKENLQESQNVFIIAVGNEYAQERILCIHRVPGQSGQK